MTARMKMMRMKEVQPTMKLEPGMIVRIQGKRTRYKMDHYQPRFPAEYANWLMEHGCGHYNQHDATKIQRVVHNFKRGLISADEAIYCLSQISRGKPIA